MRSLSVIHAAFLLCAALLILLSAAAAQELTPIPRPAKDTVRAAPGDTAQVAGAPGDTAAAAPGDTARAAAADTAREDTVSYSASRIRYRNDRFSLSDKALLKYRGSTLIADSIVYHSKENLVEAMGAPLIQDPDNPPILGYRMKYNLKTKVGEIYYGSSHRGNQTFNGVEVRRQADGDIYIARGDFSTCELPYPHKHYYFYSRRMILEPKSKVLSGPIVMDIADVPVAVLPMMVMPLGTGRRSGLLQPKFGGDQSQGFYMTNLGYYWAISEYMDYMTSADLIEGERGTFDKTNINALFRYNVRYLINGSLGGKYYISEFDPSRAGWHVDYANDWTITPDGRQTLKGSGRFQSDPGIVDRNALNEAEKSQQTSNANLGYRRQFDRLGASLTASFDQNYNLTDGNLNRSLPNVAFSAGGPLFPEGEDGGEGFGVPAEAGSLLEEDPWWRQLSWSYNNQGNVYYVRRPGTAGAGGTTAGGDTNTYVGYKDALSLTGKFTAFQYLNLNPSVNVAQHWSLESRDPSAPGGSRTAWDPAEGDLGEYFPSFNTALSMDTRFFGIAQAEGDPWFGAVQGVRHTVIPTVSFTYAPEIDTNPRLIPNPRIAGPVFQSEQRTVGLSLDNEVDMKLGAADTSRGGTAKKAEPYKLASTSSSVSYNFAAERREWSDISSTFTVYLTRNVPFTVSATHALYDDFAPDEAAREDLTAPILTRYSFAWRKGLQLAGDFSSGLRVRDTRGFPSPRFEKTPWSADMNYSFAFESRRVGGDDGDPLSRLLGLSGTYQHIRTHNAGGSLKLNPTAGWQMSYDTDYNFSEGRFSRHTFAFHRTLHCWEMDFRWTPVGLSEGWNFVIRITELPEVKLESSDTRTRRR
jgi:hypothetical protein